VTPSLVSASAPLAEYLAATAIDLGEVIFAGVMGYPSRRPGDALSAGAV